MDGNGLSQNCSCFEQKCDIIYEYGRTILSDNIEDPLPFDLTADVIVIEDREIMPYGTLI